MEQILIATDFSENAWQATLYGYKLATELKANIILLTTFVPPMEIPGGGSIAWSGAEYDELLKQCQEELVRIKIALLMNAGHDEFSPSIKIDAKAGEMIDIIKSVVIRNKISLIIIGTHSGELLHTVFLGSNARRMIDGGSTPLLLVPPNSSLVHVKTVTLVVDFNEPDREAEAIHKLIPFLKSLDCSLNLVYIYSGSDHYASTVQLLKNTLADIASKVSYPRVTFEVVRMGTVAQGIDWLCTFGRIDMLAMVHRKHSFFKRLVSPSHTQQAAKHLKLPLLVLQMPE
jgi:nucleotide-binding universal stress UspA family protein